MRRRSLRRNRRPSRLAVQQLEPRLALAVTPSLVTDINATPLGSFPFTPTAVGDVAYFAAGDAEHGQELWKTDGTLAGTTLVKDISIGPLGSSEPYSFTAVGEKVFFSAHDEVHGRELWVTDGTEDGTQLVADLATGSIDAWDPVTRTWGLGPAQSGPKDLTAFDGELYFIADAGDANGEVGLVAQLWKTDGTAAGTVQVATEGGPVTAAFVLGDSLVYMAFDSENQEFTLFTVGVSEPVASIPGAYTPSLTVIGSRAYFANYTNSAGQEPWVTDGTADGTFMLLDAAPGDDGDEFSASPNGSNPGNFIAVGEAVYFTTNAYDAASGYDSKLWKTTGSEGGTTLVKDGFRSFIDDLAVVGGRIVFAADDGENGVELWQSDGTAEGTSLLEDLAPGEAAPSGGAPNDLPVPLSGSPFGFTNLGDDLYFFANHGDLWKTDGTAEGTELVSAIGDDDASGSFGMMAVLGDELLFRADDGETGVELWKSDGTAEGTELLRDIASGTNDAFNPFGPPPAAAVLGGFAYFAADDGISGTELWKSDGTAAGTSHVRDIFGGRGPSDPTGMFTFKNEVYFAARDGFNPGDTGRELWKTDGTTEGTVLVLDIAQTDDEFSSYSLNSNPRGFAAVGDFLYFIAEDGEGTSGIWKTDGTADGTAFVAAFDGTFSENRLVAIGDYVFFAGTASGTGGIGTEIWYLAPATDEFSSIDLIAGEASSFPSQLVAHDGLLYFVADLEGTAGLWVLPGDVPDEFDPPNLFEGQVGTIAIVNDTVYFSGLSVDADGEATYLLYATDGTPDGTGLASVPGLEILPDVAPLASIGSLLLFVDQDADHGRELWTASLDPGEGPTGRVADGYLRGARVFADFDGDRVLDWTDAGLLNGVFDAGEGEAWTVTDASGNFVFPDPVDPTAALVTIGGVDISTGLSFTGTLSAPAGSTIVNPLTTLVVAAIGNGLSEAAAKAQVLAGLGLPAVDLTTYDPLAAPAEDVTALAVQKAAATVANIIVQAVANNIPTAAVLANMAQQVTTATAPVDLASPTVITQVLTVAAVAPPAAVVSQLASVNQAIVEAPNLGAVYASQVTGQSRAASVAENSTTVATVVPEGLAPGQTVTFSILGGADVEIFAIDSSGVLSFKTAPNFEAPTDAGANNVYDVTVQAGDGTNTFTQGFVVTVTNVNEAPTDIAVSAATIAENAAVGTAIGTLSSTDPDAGNTFTYALVAGEGSTDNGSFTIDGNTLKTAASFNFEARTSYFVRVRSTDAGGLSTEKQFTITVTDVVEPLAIDRVDPPASRLYRAGEVLQFTVVLTRPVTVIGKPEIDLTVGRTRTKAVYLSGSGSNQLAFTYTVKARDNDADGVALGNVIRLPRRATIRLDATNLPVALAAVNTSGVRIDTTPPKVNAVSGPANGSYKAGQVLRFTATVSEPVTVTGVPTLPLTIGTTVRQAAYVAGASTPTSLVFEYTVEAGETDSNGIAAGRAIVLPSGASIVDGAGNAALLAIRAPNLARVLVDSAGPVATSIKAPAAKTYGANAPIEFVVNFNERVVVTGSPTLPVQIGSATRSAAFAGYAARSGNKSLVFRVSPQAGDADADGVSITGPLGLGDAGIADAAGNAAAGTLPSVNLSRVLVDGIGPTIQAVAEPTVNGPGTVVFVRIGFSEPVLLRGAPTIPFQIGGSPRQFVYAGGSKTSVLTFRYAIGRNDNFELDVTPGTAIVLAGGSAITDRFGNALAPLDLPNDVVF